MALSVLFSSLAKERNVFLFCFSILFFLNAASSVITGHAGMESSLIADEYDTGDGLEYDPVSSEIDDDLQAEMRAVEQAEEEENVLLNNIFSGSNCYYTTPLNQSTERIKTSMEVPQNGKAKYHIKRFSEGLNRKGCKSYVLGNMVFLENAYHTLTILEPIRPGTCNGNLFPAPLSTVEETISNHKPRCRLAANAGFFNRKTGSCFGNIVSDGRIIQSAGSLQDANFGIKQDGTIVVGYISDAEVYNETNPFRMLLTGVVWLVRNRTNIVNESMYVECARNSRGISMNSFVHIRSARAAIGHDEKGRVVLARVEGKSLIRGINLVEFADMLIKRGVVNAVNLDGGGSSILIEGETILNYPADYCHINGKDPLFHCPRKVSTALCVHDIECTGSDCSNHGSCNGNNCHCDTPWYGKKCDLIDCDKTNCNGHGHCTNRACVCNAGWYGSLCEKPCSRNRYGLDCKSICNCVHERSFCHHVTGQCICFPGYGGPQCAIECDKNHYGVNCVHECNCVHGTCSKINGYCKCHRGWAGKSCEDKLWE